MKLKIFCKHKNQKWIGRHDNFDVFYCSDCNKYHEFNKYINVSTGWMKMPSDIGNFSDGYHTFNQLYHQRTMLFATIVNQNKSHAWKTHRHEDGELCFGGGWFLVTIDTPQGSYGYHCEEKYWELFDCPEIEKAKHWDGYTEENVDRLFSLIND